MPVSNTVQKYSEYSQSCMDAHQIDYNRFPIYFLMFRHGQYLVLLLNGTRCLMKVGVTF